MSSAFASRPARRRSKYAAQVQRSVALANKGVCKDGCDFDSFRMGKQTVYSPGSRLTIDTTRNFTIATQFVTSDNTATDDLVEIRRLFKQDNRVVDTPNSMWPGLNDVNSITDSMCNTSKKLFDDQNDHKKWPTCTYGRAYGEGTDTAMSLWSDHAAYCLWLESSYPAEADSRKPGGKRGSYPTSDGRPAEVEAGHPNVKFMNTCVGGIGSTY